MGFLKKVKELSCGWVISKKIGVAIVNVPEKFPFYNEPRRFQTSKIGCPICNEQRCHIMGASTTLMAYRNEGVHEHDPNLTTHSAWCLNDHTFIYTFNEQCAISGCTYGAGSLKVIMINEVVSPANGVISYVGKPTYVGKMPARQDIVSNRPNQ